MTVQSAFVGNFPPWSLELYQQDPPLFQTLLASRRSIYLYMFILLAGILVFGLTLTIRIVSRELELGKMKSDFVSTVSHEFKSPLTSIRQLAEMLQAGRVASEQHRQRYYDVLVEQSQRLSKLIDNILRFARLEAGKKPFKLVAQSPETAVSKAGEIVRSHLEGLGFEFHEQLEKPLPPVRHDTEALMGAILNLLSNAKKYSGDGREIRLEAEAQGGEVHIRVLDRGVGIPAGEHHRIFEKFYRGQGDHMDGVGGSGLGLALVHHVVNAHEGTIHVAERPGGGTVFTLVLPAVRKNLERSGPRVR